MDYVHSGDIGDIIYALPVIKASGGGNLIVTHTPGRTSHGMTAEKVNRFKPLLLEQSYIHSVTFDPSATPSSIDGFRHHGSQGNVADMHLATHGLSWESRIEPWITVTPDPRCEVIFVKTERYNNPHFKWQRIYDKYRETAAFIGFKKEHSNFEANYGPIPFIDSNCFLMLAKIIAGCKLYVGNYTAMTAIAEGMKHPQMIVEIHPQSSHLGVFERFGCLLAWDSKIELPKI